MIYPGSLHNTENRGISDQKTVLHNGSYLPHFDSESYTAIKLLFASFAFWMKISGPVLYTAYELSNFAKYPTEIYEKGVKFIITWIIPFAFVAYLPASFFLKPDVSFFATIGIECILAVVFFAIAYFVFCKGTSAYESAGN